MPSTPLLVRSHVPALNCRGLTCRALPALLFAAVTWAQGAPLPDDRRAGAASVDLASCKAWLHELASPAFEGRGTGQPGYQKAADFVAAHFRAVGLEARGEDGTYFQHVPWSTAVVDADQTFVVFRHAGREGNGELRRIPNNALRGTATTSLSARGDVVLLVVTPKAPAEADPAPAGEGARRRALPMPNVDGLADIDVKGKIVVAHVRRRDGERAGAPMAEFAVRRALQGKEPAALLFAHIDPVEGGLRGGGGMNRRGGNPAAAGAGIAPTDITFGGADFAALLAAAGLAAGELDQAPVVNQVAVTAEIEVNVESASAPAMNVFGVLKGSDPALQSEYVVIGSHLDHLGRSGDAFFPGADDDASGTTGVMAVAQMLANSPIRPRRSVLFVCFSGEERGLLGSRYFANNSPIPLPSVVAELQMDMIGRDEEEARDGQRLVNKGELAEQNRNSLHLVGTQKLAPALHELCVRLNERAGFELEYDQESLFDRSDHANFAQQGVPIAFFFTGLHRDYHQVSDTPDKIHYNKLLRVATYVYDLGYELANQPNRPEIDPALWKQFRQNARRQQPPEKPAAPLREAAGGKGGDRGGDR